MLRKRLLERLELCIRLAFEEDRKAAFTWRVFKETGEKNWELLQMFCEHHYRSQFLREETEWINKMLGETNA